MDMYRIHNMLEDVSEAASTELSKGTESVNTKELGDVVDMIKDLSEAEKNKWQSCYYKSVVEAMENAEYGEDYDWMGPDEDRMGYPRGMSGGRSRRGYRGQGNQGSRYGGRRNYDEMMYDERMGYSNGAYGGGSRGMSSNQGSSRYGYSYDKYMNNRANYSMNDPEDKQERMKMLEEYTQDLVSSVSTAMKDVSPEEKNMLKNKLTKLVNTMQ